MFQVGDYIEVFDKELLLLSGKVIKTTDNPTGCSIDGILFFNPTSDKFCIKKGDASNLETSITNMEAIQGSNYILIKNNNIDNTFQYDFFMWTEIEPEVKETVDLLNSLGFIETYSSCSGHNKIPAYIDFNILNYEKFFNFIYFLNKDGIISYCRKHGELEENDFKLRFIVGVEGLNTCHLELVNLNTSFEVLNKAIIKYKRFTI